MYTFLLIVGCTSPDKLIGDSNVFADPDEPIVIPDTAIGPNPDSGIEPDNTSVNGVLSGGAEVGEEVNLEGLVVTTPSTDNGFYAADPEGGTESGIWIQADFSNKGIFEVEIGQQFNVTGVYAEVLDDAVEHTGEDNSNAMILVSAPDQLVIPENQILMDVEAEVVTIEALANPSIAETYEGVLVKIADVVLTGGETTAYINGTVPVGQRFIEFDPTDIEPVQLAWIYGVIGYEAGQYTIFPRTYEDAIYARNSLADMTAEQLFISEVFYASSPASNCTPDLNWYLELYYNPTNELGLLADTLYLWRYNSVMGTNEVSKIVPDAGVIDRNDVGIISDVNTSTCLATDSDSSSVLQHQTEIVSVLSPVSGVEPGDEFQLIHAATVDDFTSGVHTTIQTVIVDTNLQADVSRAFNSADTPTDVEDTSNNSWCHSEQPLVNTNGDLLSGTYIPNYKGTPGTVESHCQ